MVWGCFGAGKVGDFYKVWHPNSEAVVVTVTFVYNACTCSDINLLCLKLCQCVFVCRHRKTQEISGSCTGTNCGLSVD